MSKRSTLSPAIVRCAIYIRKSTVKGLEQQYNSLEAQEDRCKSFISLHEAQGWVYETTFSDAGISGGTTQRPALQDLLNAARKKKFDMVIVFKLDRLARNQRDFLNLLDTLSKNGVEVASATEPFDSASYLGRAMRNLLGVFAEMEREMISERTREKAEASRRKGLYLSGRPPLGYVRVDGRLQIVPKDAEVIRMIFEEYAKGGTCFTVAEYLLRMNILKKKLSGEFQPWAAKDIQRTLRNVLYAGFVASGDELYPGQHQPIIEKELWDAVQKRLDAAQKEVAQRMRPRRQKLVYPLSGVLRCAKCGKPMFGTYGCKDGNVYRYYTCRTRKQLGASSCACPNLNAQEIETFICEQMSSLNNNPDFVAAVISRIPHVPGGKVSDCLFNMEHLLSYGSPDELKTIFKQVFSVISFDWENDKIDFKYKDLT